MDDTVTKASGPGALHAVATVARAGFAPIRNDGILPTFARLNSSQSYRIDGNLSRPIVTGRQSGGSRPRGGHELDLLPSVSKRRKRSSSALLDGPWITGV